MNSSKYVLILFLIIPLFSTAAEINDSSFIEGQKLFRKNCSACHNVHKELTGPMLASITKKKPEEWLLSFIKNSQRVILSGDVYASFLFTQYNRTVMPAFEHLSEKEIKYILKYIETESKVKQVIHNHEKFNDMPGKELYRNHCLTCHQINYEDYGPSLGSIYRRRPTDWIIKFVTNSETVIQNDNYADSLYTKFDNKRMPSFYFLNEQSIIDILEYIDAVSKSDPQVAGVNGNNLSKRSNVVGLPSIQFINKSAQDSHVDFGVFALATATVIMLVIYFFILKMLYKELVKSQK